MSKILKQLEAHSKSRNLVSLRRRKKVDDGRMQGIVLGYSAEIVLLLHVYDFQLNGLTFLNTRDIKSIKSTVTDKLQHQILLEEELLTDEILIHDYPLSSWKELLLHISKEELFLILEDENPEDDIFLIGKIARVTDFEVHVYHFNGPAEWDPDPRKLGFDYITCCQLSSSYLNKYEAYFNRHPEFDFKISE